MKSDYSKESITEFLSRKYGEDIRLFPIKEGQESQAYWFRVAAENMSCA